MQSTSLPPHNPTQIFTSYVSMLVSLITKNCFVFACVDQSVNNHAGAKVDFLHRVLNTPEPNRFPAQWRARINVLNTVTGS
jgi:hypothetical protein